MGTDLTAHSLKGHVSSFPNAKENRMSDDMEKNLAQKSYEESLANDFFVMISEARENGVDLSEGFETTPLSMQNATLRYMFYNKKFLKGTTMPMALKKKLGVSNILTAVEVNGQAVGIFLVCTLPIPLDKVETEEQVLKGIQTKALYDFKDKVALLMQRGLETDQNMSTH